MEIVMFCKTDTVAVVLLSNRQKGKMMMIEDDRPAKLFLDDPLFTPAKLDIVWFPSFTT